MSSNANATRTKTGTNEGIEPQVHSTNAEGEGILSESSTRVEDIRHRAYEIYLERSQEPGRELDDWLQAEREMKSSPS